MPVKHLFTCAAADTGVAGMGYPRTEPLFGATVVSNAIVELYSATMMGAMARNNCCELGGLASQGLIRWYR